MHLTENDRRLLALLQSNARMPISELAKELSLARTTVRNRIERLEQMDVISGYTVKLSPKYLGSLVEAHVLLKVDPKQGIPSKKKITGFPEVSELYSISGEFDFVAIIKAESSERLDEVLINLRDMGSVLKTHSSIILTKWFSR